MNSPQLVPVTYSSIPIYQFISNEIVPTDPPSTTTIRPKENESTTPPSIFVKKEKPEKLVAKNRPIQSRPQQVSQQIKIVRAVQQPNNQRFRIQTIQLAPGQRIIKQNIGLPPRYRTNPIRQKKYAPLVAPPVVVTAMGSTSVDKPVARAPDVFDYYVPNNPIGDTSLILEPSARAVAGNDGTAISAPLSRALIRRGTTTRILFKPDSVAIAGPGGRAHAHADLIVDYLDS